MTLAKNIPQSEEQRKTSHRMERNQRRSLNILRPPTVLKHRQSPSKFKHQSKYKQTSSTFTNDCQE